MPFLVVIINWIEGNRAFVVETYAAPYYGFALVYMMSQGVHKRRKTRLEKNTFQGIPVDGSGWCVPSRFKTSDYTAHIYISM